MTGADGDRDDDEDRDDEWGLSERGPFRDGKVHVLDGKCATCIFRPGNLMMLAAGRVKQMVSDCLQEQTAIPCHSTLGTDAPALCRGFWDRYRRDVMVLRLAQAMEVVEYDPVPVKGAR